jgi:hypothetical protein
MIMKHIRVTRAFHDFLENRVYMMCRYKTSFVRVSLQDVPVPDDFLETYGNVALVTLPDPNRPPVYGKLEISSHKTQINSMKKMFSIYPNVPAAYSVKISTNALVSLRGRKIERKTAAPGQPDDMRMSYTVPKVFISKYAVFWEGATDKNGRKYMHYLDQEISATKKIPTSITFDFSFQYADFKSFNEACQPHYKFGHYPMTVRVPKDLEAASPVISWPAGSWYTPQKKEGLVEMIPVGSTQAYTLQLKKAIKSGYVHGLY